MSVQTHADWIVPAKKNTPRAKCPVDGSFVDAVSGCHFDSITPATGAFLTEMTEGCAPGSAHFFQWHAEAMDKIYDEMAPTDPGDPALVTREPLGVVGAVTPWNFLLNMAT